MASTSDSFRRACSSFAAKAAFLRALAARAFFDGTRIVDLLSRRSCSGLEVLNCRIRGVMHYTISKQFISKEIRRNNYF